MKINYQCLHCQGTQISISQTDVANAVCAWEFVVSQGQAVLATIIINKSAFYEGAPEPLHLHTKNVMLAHCFSRFSQNEKKGEMCTMRVLEMETRMAVCI